MIVACPMICMGELSAVVRVSRSPGSVIAVFIVSGFSLYACKLISDTAAPESTSAARHFPAYTATSGQESAADIV